MVRRPFYSREIQARRRSSRDTKKLITCSIQSYQEHGGRLNYSVLPLLPFSFSLCTISVPFTLFLLLSRIPASLSPPCSTRESVGHRADIGVRHRRKNESSVDIPESISSPTVCSRVRLHFQRVVYNDRLGGVEQGGRVLVFGVPFGMDVFQRDFKFGADGLNLPACRY